MTQEEKAEIEYISNLFDGWIFNAINDLLQSKGVSLGFVLMTCAIDYLVSFNCGGEKTTRKLGKLYKDFLNEYNWFCKKYNPGDIYHSLRCELVHQFSIKNGKFILIHNKPDLHLKKINGKIILNYQDFFEDIKRLKNEFFDKLLIDSIKRGKFFKKLNKKGFLGPKEIKFDR